MHPSLPLENIRKPQGFLMFTGGRERVRWEQMGSYNWNPDYDSAADY